MLKLVLLTVIVMGILLMMTLHLIVFNYQFFIKKEIKYLYFFIKKP